MIHSKKTTNNYRKICTRIIKFFVFLAILAVFNSSVPLFATTHPVFNETVNLSTTQIKATFYDSRENCAFIKTHCKKNIIINGIEDRRSEWYRDIRNNLREPMRVFIFFESSRIADIDAAVLTSPSYITAMRRMVDDFNVRKVYVPDIPVKGYYRAFLDYLTLRNIGFEFFKTGDIIKLGSTELEILKCSNRDNGRPIESIVRFSYKETKILFAGRASLTSQNYLREKVGENLISTILKLVNYGYSPLDSEFIKKVNPGYTIIFANPDKTRRENINSIVNKCAYNGSEVFRSDSYNIITMEGGTLQQTYNSTIRIISDGYNYKIVSPKNLDKIKEEIFHLQPPQIEYSYNRMCCKLLDTKIKEETPYVEVLLDGDYFPAVAREIDQAVHSIYMVMFFVNMGQRDTNPVNILIDKLIQARQRGVKVKVLLEKPRERDEDDFDFLDYNNTKVYRWLANAGIDARMSPPEEKTHHKYIVFDNEFTVIGNHNWSQTALEGTQYEAAVLIQSEAVARRFINNYYDSLN